MRASLLAEIQQALGQAVIPSLTAADAMDDLYEAYVFGLLLKAARIERGSVSLMSIAGGALGGTFTFRTSPGYLNSTRHDYGYAIIRFPRCPALEAHVGVRVAGKSNVLHECDVCIIQESEAELCRRSTTRVAPRSAKLVIAVEAKFYTTDLGLHLGRAFLGLVRDLSADSKFFVFNREAESIEKLLSHTRELWENNILPSNPIQVTRLINAFQTAFKDYKARARL